MDIRGGLSVYLSIFATGLFEFLAAVTDKGTHTYFNGLCGAFMLMSIMYFIVSLVNYTKDK